MVESIRVLEKLGTSKVSDQVHIKVVTFLDLKPILELVVFDGKPDQSCAGGRVIPKTFHQELVENGELLGLLVIYEILALGDLLYLLTNFLLKLQVLSEVVDGDQDQMRGGVLTGEVESEQLLDDLLLGYVLGLVKSVVFLGVVRVGVVFSLELLLLFEVLLDVVVEEVVVLAVLRQSRNSSINYVHHQLFDSDDPLPESLLLGGKEELRDVLLGAAFQEYPPEDEIHIIQ